MLFAPARRPGGLCAPIRCALGGPGQSLHASRMAGPHAEGEGCRSGREIRHLEPRPRPQLHRRSARRPTADGEGRHHRRLQPLRHLWRGRGGKDPDRSPPSRQGRPHQSPRHFRRGAPGTGLRVAPDRRKGRGGDGRVPRAGPGWARRAHPRFGPAPARRFLPTPSRTLSRRSTGLG